MHIVQIEDFFHPNAGYQVNVLSQFFSRAGNKVTIITAELEKIPDSLTAFFGKDNVAESDKVYEEKYAVKIIRVPVRKYISGRVWFSNDIFRIVDELKPDVLYVHGNDTLIAIQYFFKLGRIPYAVVSDSHMLEMASQNKFNKLFRAFYRTFITPKLVKYHVPVIRTQDDPYVKKCLGIPLENCPWISFGSDTTLFHPCESEKKEFRERNGINKDAFVVVYAGKLDEGKGGLLLAEAFKKRISEKREVVLLVVGNTVGEYGKKVEEIFSESENRIIRYPAQQYVNLSPFYQASDLAVFARQCSLSFYDVQACGLPVIAEDNNINIARCSHLNGECFDSGNIDALIHVIRKFAEMPENELKNFSKNSVSFIQNGYDYADKSKEYLEIINSAYSIQMRDKSIISCNKSFL